MQLYSQITRVSQVAIVAQEISGKGVTTSQLIDGTSVSTRESYSNS
jgi:hypothetical protein